MKMITFLMTVFLLPLIFLNATFPLVHLLCFQSVSQAWNSFCSFLTARFVFLLLNSIVLTIVATSRPAHQRYANSNPEIAHLMDDSNDESRPDELFATSRENENTEYRIAGAAASLRSRSVKIVEIMDDDLHDHHHDHEEGDTIKSVVEIMRENLQLQLVSSSDHGSKLILDSVCQCQSSCRGNTSSSCDQAIFDHPTALRRTKSLPAMSSPRLSSAPAPASSCPPFLLKSPTVPDCLLSIQPDLDDNFIQTDLDEGANPDLLAIDCNSETSDNLDHGEQALTLEEFNMKVETFIANFTKQIRLQMCME